MSQASEGNAAASVVNHDRQASEGSARERYARRAGGKAAASFVNHDRQASEGSARERYARRARGKAAASCRQSRTHNIDDFTSP